MALALALAAPATLFAEDAPEIPGSLDATTEAPATELPTDGENTEPPANPGDDPKAEDPDADPPGDSEPAMPTAAPEPEPEQTAAPASAEVKAAALLTGVPYLDAAGTLSHQDATELTGGETTLTDGWYAVTANTKNFTQRISVTGDVNLILADGVNVTASGGIGVNNSSLTIYGQSCRLGAAYRLRRR